jgi:hypothetical protein
LASPETWSLVDHAVYQVGLLGARPYAVELSAETVGLRLARVSRPGEAGAALRDASAPWRAVPGGWEADRGALTDAADLRRSHVPRPSDTYAALGSRGAAIVLLDLAAVPGFLSVVGVPRTALRLVSSLTQQMLSTGRHRVFTADGALPGVPSAGTDDLLDQLDRTERTGPAEPAPADGAASLTFFVCARPDARQLVLLRRALVARPRLRVILLGDSGGTQWTLVAGRGSAVGSRTLGLAAATAAMPDRIPARPPFSPPDAASRAAQTVKARPRRTAARGLEPLPPRGAGADPVDGLDRSGR